MLKFRKKIQILFITGLIALTSLNCSKESKQDTEVITPATVQGVIAIDEKTPRRIIDLYSIVIALEKYKRANNSYPFSSGPKASWDGLFSDLGESRADWIKGLVPLYLDKLPADPRGGQSVHTQYLYRSDGANYKLIARNPDDCKKVKLTYPNVIDPKRDCSAYGFWTDRAAKW